MSVRNAEPEFGIRPLSGEVTPIGAQERAQLHTTMQDPVHYRKSGLSLNHIVGCPLECAYCIRHSVGAYELKQPRFLCSDEEAVHALTSHHYFQAGLTPLQLFNKATDPFLPAVKPHTFKVIELLDGMRMTNHLLVITRYHVSAEDCKRLNQVRNLKLSLLITYSGIEDQRIEPISNAIPRASLETAFACAQSYKVILYWRPLVPGLNDSHNHVATAVDLSRHAHATVFTGLFFRSEMKAYFESMGLPDICAETARRKILPRELEARILEFWEKCGGPQSLFRKTSCGVSYAHRVNDYNGHYGIREICDICPARQIDVCATLFSKPTGEQVDALLSRIGRASTQYRIGESAVETVGLDEPPRYFLQHHLGFQVHDIAHPHYRYRHGRADIGWTEEDGAA